MLDISLNRSIFHADRRIKALQTNPGVLSKALDSGDYLRMISCARQTDRDRCQPSTTACRSDPQSIAVRAFQAGDLSLGQVAQVFEKPKEETMRLLSELGVAIADYDLAEDLETLEMLGSH